MASGLMACRVTITWSAPFWKASTQFSGALGPVSPTNFARAAAPSMNAPNDLNETFGTRCLISSAIIPGQVMATFKQ